MKQLILVISLLFCKQLFAGENSDSIKLHNFIGLSTSYSYQNERHSLIKPTFFITFLNPDLGTIIYKNQNNKCINYWNISQATRVVVSPLALIGAIVGGILLDQANNNNNKSKYTPGLVTIGSFEIVAFSLAITSDIYIKKCITEYNNSIRIINQN